MNKCSAVAFSSLLLPLIIFSLFLSLYATVVSDLVA